LAAALLCSTGGAPAPGAQDVIDPSSVVVTPLDNAYFARLEAETY
jgi:hypothetical protein